MGSNKLTSNPMYHRRTKHINMRYHFIRELVHDKIVKVSFMSTKDMVADVLTKALAAPAMSRHLASMGVARL
jgi:hypothetical protein